MHLFCTHASLNLALVPKGCNFNAPETLIQQFLIAIFSHFLPTVLWWKIANLLRIRCLSGKLKDQNPHNRAKYKS